MTDRIALSASLTDDPGLAERAEELGYESLWVPEGQGKSAFGKLERMATVTDEIGLATAIVNVYSRTPAAIAQSISTLDDHSGGRAILGLGVAHPGVVEGFHGMAFDRPIARMAEYVELVRLYLAAEDEPYDGEFFSPERVRLWDRALSRPDIPIYNAALGPKNVELTGERAEGWFPYLMPRSRLEEALGWLETGAERAGRSVDDVDVAMMILASVDEDPDLAYRSIAEHVVVYMRGDIPGYYSRVAENAGFEDMVAAAQAADSTGEAVEHITDEFVDLIAIAGEPDEAREKLEAFRESGVDLPIVLPTTLGSSRYDTLDATMETLAPF